MGAKLLNTASLIADCAGDISIIESTFVTIDGSPVVLAGTKVDGAAVVPLSAPLITIEGKSVLTTDDVYTAHTLPGPDPHSAGSLSSAASSVSLA